MNMQEVELLTGISSRNILFYEKEVLLTPCRNQSNNYREYSEKDLKILKEIKLPSILLKYP